MNDTLSALRKLDLVPLRSSLVDWLGLDSKLVDSAELGKLAWKLGFGHFSENCIHVLWRIGLLRADVVTAEMFIDVPGFVPIPSPHEFRFTDVRLPKQRPQGASSFVPKRPSPEDHLTAYFHPYRVFLLHHVVRSLRIETSNTQYLIGVEGVQSVVNSQIHHLQRWTESEKFIERFDHWNRVTELAIVCEPVRHLRSSLVDISNTDLDWQQAYFHRLGEVLRSLPSYEIRSIRQAFAMSANELDSNSRLHTLLRLMKPFERDRIEGQIGAAIKFLDMAESLRRATEHFLQVHLPEEDEIGPGTWMAGARRNLYGTDRVFDASPSILRDYLGTFGLDAGVKVRCYVEGETELGALRHALGASNQCTFINLRGSVVEKKRRSLGFVDSLAADKAGEMFSFIMLDGDRVDFVRALRKAASEDVFHGVFLVSEPDIEVANFTVAELLDIALTLSSRTEGGTSIRTADLSNLLQGLAGVTSGKEFFHRLRMLVPPVDMSKGEDWGSALMEYAIKKPNFPLGHRQSGKERPLIEFARRLIRAQAAGFRFSLEREQVDVESGGLRCRLRVSQPR